MASALRGHALGGKLDPVRLEEAVEDFIAFRIERHPMTSLLGHVLDLRGNFTVDDAAYLVLAQALEAPIVSADAKLREATRPGIEVRFPD